MAHQAHNIPWHTLASNFDLIKLPQIFNDNERHFVPLFKPNQAKELNHFTVAFARAIAEFSATERRKHSTLASACNIYADDEVVSEAAATRIEEFFQKLKEEGIYGFSYMQSLLPLWYSSKESYAKNTRYGLVKRTDKEVADYEGELRKMKASPRSARCWKGEDRYGDEHTLDVLVFLLQLGEIESLFKIARYAPETIKRNWYWEDHVQTWGLKKLMERTVDFYVGLNVLYCKPEWYDNVWKSMFDETLLPAVEKSSSRPLPPAESIPIQFIREKDYRCTSIYATILGNHHLYGPLGYGYGILDLGEAWAIPHRRFFGDNATFNTKPSFTVGDPDPLKDGGGKRLKEYLKICWNLLVRLDILMQEVGFGIDWQQVVAASIAGWFPRFEEKFSRWIYIEHVCWDKQVLSCLRYYNRVEFV